MKTVFITLTAMLLLSGCVYRVPGHTHHRVGPTYTYITPVSHTHTVEKERIVRPRVDPQHHRVEKSRPQPTVHPQYRKPQQTKNDKKLKEKHRKKSEKQHASKPPKERHPNSRKKEKGAQRTENGPKIHPRYVENKKHTGDREENAK